MTSLLVYTVTPNTWKPVAKHSSAHKSHSHCQTVDFTRVCVDCASVETGCSDLSVIVVLFLAARHILWVRRGMLQMLRKNTGQSHVARLNRPANSVFDMNQSGFIRRRVVLACIML